jgi:hypothetical protein
MVCLLSAVYGFAALLEERMESVYKQDPRYNDKATSMFNLDLGAPEVRSSSSVGP